MKDTLQALLYLYPSEFKFDDFVFFYLYIVFLDPLGTILQLYMAAFDLDFLVLLDFLRYCCCRNDHLRACSLCITAEISG